MEGHLLKTRKLVRSHRWSQIEDDFTRLVYCLLLGAVDSWGMLPADGFTLKAELDPTGKQPVDSYPRAVASLMQVGLLRIWEHQGRPWLYVIGHDKEQKRGITKRKKSPEVPRPDDCDTHPHLVVPKKQPVAGKAHNEGELEVEVEVEGEVEVHKRSSPSPSTTTSRLGDFATGALDEARAAQERNVQPAAARPAARANSPAMLDDHRPGGLQPELEVISALYAELWGVDPSHPPVLDDDHLRRARIALSDDRAGITHEDRIKTSHAAVRGHHRKASVDGYEYGRDLQHVFPEARIGGRRASNKLDMSRYLALAQNGRAATRAPVESQAEVERREREAEIVKEMDTPEGIERRKGQLSKGKELFNKAANEAKKGATDGP